MATIFCRAALSDGTENTSPYETWAKAATSLQTAITAASTGDTVVIQYDAVPTGDAEVSADTTYVFDAHGVIVISASNDGTNAYTPTAMGTANWIGNSTTNYTIQFGGAFRYETHGLTIRVSGTTADNIGLAQSDNSQQTATNCLFWLANTSTTSRILLGGANNSAVHAKNCKFRFSHASQGFSYRTALIEGGSVDSAGTAPSTLFVESSANMGSVACEGFDVSFVGSGTLVGNNSAEPCQFTFTRCKLGSGMTVLATQTGTARNGNFAYLFDCHSGDTHGVLGYYDGLGSMLSDTGIYFTAGAAAQSWKIVTTANASQAVPFVSPWVSRYHTGTSAITPRLEILRDGSATAYTNAEVWGEFSAKTTSGTVNASFSGDRVVIGATPADQATGAGLGSWTGENATAWSGKVDSGSSITPAEAGHIRGRVMVGAASATVYVNPQIETA